MDVKLTLEELQELEILNARLKNLGTKLLSETITIDTQLSKRVEDKNDILDDYELEIRLEFYLKNEDTMLIFLVEHLKGISKDNSKQLRFEENHNEFLGWENHPMKDENHSWWYHCLYDHTDLGFKDMAKIGIIWSDIEVSYQYQDLPKVLK
jgi:hypothetical protein